MILLGHQFWLVDPLAGIGISVWGTQHLTVAAVERMLMSFFFNLADTGMIEHLKWRATTVVCSWTFLKTNDKNL